MAKTLIGNIKGKDGRGIASISKTGTTGSVDTYTIKYTDNTTSTYTVNNSDSISLQRQIVPSAAVESSATASQAYAAGDYVVVGGVLRKVKAAIARGNAISNSNSTATTVTGELANFVPQIVDRGTSGIWRYTKYADGTAECCGTTVYIINRTGNFWLPDIRLPFDFVKPANSCNDFTVIVSGGSSFARDLYPYYPKAGTSISSVSCAVGNATGTGEIIVGYFVSGTLE